ncbi:carbonic anhydrase [Roseicyclus sp. F158]|uniref:Carbonic anhydrase n=1 Tax=Tropicimonas omnivorans TaxID=3075590 RepID=A0ABU3DBG6_9RHOB|nr:carbonic anhydrase [Roseicyclus sp. F158]MDT0681056.1 carbonic anhydrase [Roseicyclus sp. F158]
MADNDSPILVRPLPGFLATRYHGWKATTYAESKSWHRRLAAEGQRPRMMAIACCDSRVNVNAVFSAETGDIFLHRNIANLVPTFTPDGDHHGTSAAVEYAVRFLKVSHIIVIGHSDCGGVAGCHAMCSGEAPEFEEKTSFIGRWLDILRPGYEALPQGEDKAAQLRMLERAAVTTSLENLGTFPFVREAVEAEELSLHGLWFDIGEGTLEHYVAGEGFTHV